MGLSFRLCVLYVCTFEAAAILGLKPRSVTRHIERHNLKAEKIGRDYLIAQEELERFKRERRRTPGRPKAEERAKISPLAVDA